MPATFTDDLRLAHVLADDADSLSTSRYQALDLRVDTKPDLSPVTDADRAVEEGIRRTLSRARPRDAILGEEQGSSGFSQRRWVVDPIDGTKNFVRGVPVWATLISLMVEDEVVVGVVSAPQLNRRWWAMKDGGAFTGRSLLKPHPIRVSDVSKLEDASFSYSSLDGWDHSGRLDDFLTLSRHCWRTRAYGDFWSHMMVAEGSVDFAAEPELELYDMAALDVIVREAGGRFTSLDGRDGPTGGNALASNGILHETVLGFLGSVGPEARPRSDEGATGPEEPEEDRGSAREEPAEPHPGDPRGGTLHQLSDRRRPVSGPPPQRPQHQPNGTSTREPDLPPM
jgi:histidinol-phosphatase